ncbi:MAG TPA: family 16 glycosylhydrolase [Bacteroidia bacterium]|nr:MAG: glycoside hydrolase family protein [Bacteroidetes bacterium OLB10]MBV6454028.1 hypothetical protein [Bacteroidia bacterium]MBX3105076.1 family 16 glycosylhydrolase [Bacteroidota bacterium]OQB65910.1 MAG: Glucan endo-1,3-beta-glucosidase A1 precursor [Bacteroidetes bacterium ADurb.Bin141]MCB0849011.1 family 16 glycosylhydrolase [Bacteroidota bacterium]
MKKTIIIFVCIIAIHSKVSAQPETIWQLIDGSIIRWAYSGGDEFNGTQLDYSKWDDGYPWGRSLIGNQEQQYYKPGIDNISFDNGILKLITKYEPGYYTVEPWHSGSDILSDGQPNNRYFPWTSGMIFSKQKFKYGLFEIRFKPPVGSGLWPAYWLYGGNPNEEFDIFEYKGETPNKIHIDVHCPSNDCNNFGGWATANGNFSDGFNDIMGEWGPNFSFWYLNGSEFAIWLGNLNYQANIIANMAVANSCPATFCPGTNANTPTTSYFEIDFIRVWTRLDCQQVITICNYNQTSTDPTGITGSQITMGGTNCNAVVQNEQNLHLIATDYIELLPGFIADAGSNFSAKIVNCPVPQIQFALDSSEAAASTLHILSEVEQDSLSNSSERREAESVENNPPILYTKIYPNPTDGKISIEFVGYTDKIIAIELINSLGEKVYSKENIKDKKLDIDISPLPKGVYFLKGIFGSDSITDKIILN